MNDMIMTPGNAKRLADRLSHLRGAAMKLGQMISMDAGDMLPPELATILAGLRDRANFMPPRQLDGVLAAEWGEGLAQAVPPFRTAPHRRRQHRPGPSRAERATGATLAIKVQYPGIRDSIDSDVDNVATLAARVGNACPRSSISRPC